MAKIKKSFGQQTIGGGGSAAASPAAEINIYKVVRGQTLPTGLYGVERLSTKPVSVASWVISGSTSELLTQTQWQTGIGLAENIDSGAYVKVCNIDNFSFMSGDAYQGECYSVGSTTVNVSGVDGVAQFYPLIYGR